VPIILQITSLNNNLFTKFKFAKISLLFLHQKIFKLIRIIKFVLFQDILENEDITLDWFFRLSLISDLVNVSFEKMAPVMKLNIILHHWPSLLYVCHSDQ